MHMSFITHPVSHILYHTPLSHFFGTPQYFYADYLEVFALERI